MNESTLLPARGDRGLGEVADEWQHEEEDMKHALDALERQGALKVADEMR